MNTDKTCSVLSYLCSSAFICGSLLFLSGCNRQRQPEVVLYTSVDQPYADPIVKEFEKQTGITVRLVTDAEASKSVGLAERLRAEKTNPQADVWWSNEPFHTINLAEEGVLAPYDSPAAVGIPDRFRDREHRWTANCLRMRVIAHEFKRVPASQPASVGGLEDLLADRFQDKIAM